MSDGACSSHLRPCTSLPEPPSWHLDPVAWSEPMPLPLPSQFRLASPGSLQWPLFIRTGSQWYHPGTSLLCSLGTTVSEVGIRIWTLRISRVRDKGHEAAWVFADANTLGQPPTPRGPDGLFFRCPSSTPCSFALMACPGPGETDGRPHLQGAACLRRSVCWAGPAPAKQEAGQGFIP